MAGGGLARMIYIPGASEAVSLGEDAYETGKKAAEGTVDFAKDAGGAALHGVDDLTTAAADLPGAVEKLADDPIGYLEGTLGDLAWDQVKGSVAQGFEDMLEGVARQAGLAPLLDGLDAFADYAGEVVEKIIQLARCAPVAAQSSFYALVAGLYAARVAGLVEGKDDCERFVKTGEFVNAIGANVPVLDMLPCAIEAAFSIPLPPSDRPPAPEGAPPKEMVDRLKSGLDSSTIERALDVAGTGSLLAARAAVQPPAVGAVSRSADKLDIAVGRPNDGVMVTAAWEPGRNGWRGWWAIADGRAPPGAPVTLASRSIDKLDAFVVGLDGRVLTAAWEPSDKAWRGWWPVGDLKTLPGTAVDVVSRSGDKLDVFATSPEGIVVTAAWEPGDKAWRGWRPITDRRTSPGAPVTAVSRSADKLDVFMVALDGGVWTAAWQPDFKEWKGWWAIGDLKTLPGTAVGAVSRSADKLDVFATGADGAVRTAAWGPGDEAWRGWWEITDGRVSAGAPVTAVSRSADKLDVFTVGVDGRVWTAAWEPDFKEWKGWWAIGDLVTASATHVAAVSRSADKLDVFVRGIDRATYTAAWEPGDRGWRGWWRLT